MADNWHIVDPTVEVWIPFWSGFSEGREEFEGSCMESGLERLRGLEVLSKFKLCYETGYEEIHDVIVYQASLYFVHEDEECGSGELRPVEANWKEMIALIEAAIRVYSSVLECALAREGRKARVNGDLLVLGDNYGGYRPLGVSIVIAYRDSVNPEAILKELQDKLSSCADEGCAWIPAREWIVSAETEYFAVSMAPALARVDGEHSYFLTAAVFLAAVNYEKYETRGGNRVLNLGDLVKRLHVYAGKVFYLREASHVAMLSENNKRIIWHPVYCDRMNRFKDFFWMPSRLVENVGTRTWGDKIDVEVLASYWGATVDDYVIFNDYDAFVRFVEEFTNRFIVLIRFIVGRTHGEAKSIIDNKLIFEAFRAAENLRATLTLFLPRFVNIRSILEKNLSNVKLYTRLLGLDKTMVGIVLLEAGSAALEEFEKAEARFREHYEVLGSMISVLSEMVAEARQAHTNYLNFTITIITALALYPIIRSTLSLLGVMHPSIVTGMSLGITGGLVSLLWIVGRRIASRRIFGY